MISIVLCTYNREKLLADAIRSVISQTVEDWELIVVDDGSTDETEALVASFCDRRICYHKLEKNSYYCYAANVGISMCRGEYIAFLNSDDRWLPEKLERQMDYLDSHPSAGGCFTRVILVDGDGRELPASHPLQKTFDQHFETQKDWIRRFFYRGNCLCHPSALLRADVLREVGAFHPLYYQLGDFDLWARIAVRCPIAVLPEALIRFRWDEKAKTQISTLTEAKEIRTFNEQQMIRRDLLDRLSDEKLKEYFREDFRNPDSESELELEIERAFLLMKGPDERSSLPIFGIEKLQQILLNEDAVRVLEERFGVTLHEIYRWNTQHGYADPVLMAKQDEVVRLKEKLAQKEMEVRSYRDSTSWKCTAPFRALGTALRNVRGLRKGVSKRAHRK